jgi:xylulokinase
VRGAFVGLSSSHGIADLYQSILEGVSYEAEYIRQTAELIAGNPINLLLSTGGGIRNRRWMQIRADVTGCQVLALSQPEMALLGAALLSGIGAGVYPSIEDAANSLTREEVQSYFPNPVRHRLYQLKYESGYLQLQEPLRRFFADQVR